MSILAVQPRGGFPHIRVYTATTAGIEIQLRGLTNYVVIRNEGANELRVYVSEADYAALNSNYIPIAAAGLFEGPVQLQKCWLVSAATTTTARLIALLTH